MKRLLARRLRQPIGGVWLVAFLSSLSPPVIGEARMKCRHSCRLNCWPWLAVSSVLICVGCGGQPVADPPQSDTLAPRALAMFYGEYMTEHGGRPPKDEAEFRAFLATRGDRLAAGGLQVDQLFISPQGDGPLVVVYGTSGPLVVDGRQVVAYAKTVADDRRTIVNVRGGVELIAEAKFAAALASRR